MKLTVHSLLPGALVAGALIAAGYVALAPGPSQAPPGVGVAPGQGTARPDARDDRRARAARPQPAAVAATTGVEVVWRAPWGSGPGQLGRELPQEASAEGPMSFAVDRSGRAFVLDQVNARVVVFAQGQAPSSMALPTDTYQDIALDAHGGVAALDRLVSRAIVFLSARGEVRHQIQLEGRGVDDGGSVTGLFSRPDGTWVEVDHGALVRVALADGSPDPERVVVPGRFGAAEGSFVRAVLVNEQRAELAGVSRGGEVTPLAGVSLPADALQLNALEVDAKGRLFLGASLYREEPVAPFASRPLGDLVVVLSPAGAEEGRALFPPNTGPEEQFRQVRLGDDGALYHLGLSEEGATLRRVVR